MAARGGSNRRDRRARAIIVWKEMARMNRNRWMGAFLLGCFPAMVATVLSLTACAGSSTFDHAAWEALLQRHVQDRSVDYAAIKKDPDFERYLRQLVRARPNQLQDNDERLAFWINAYNASVVSGVLRRYPIKSVMDDRQFFKKEEHNIGGKLYSLDGIEKGLIRKEFGEPRVHFALVCASRGCPPLPSEAFAAAQLEGQLDAAAEQYIGDPHYNRFNVSGKSVSLSRIFKWYEHDFGGFTGVLDFIAAHTSAENQNLLKVRGLTVDYLNYDWSLNGTESPAGK